MWRKLWVNEIFVYVFIRPRYLLWSAKSQDYLFMRELLLLTLRRFFFSYSVVVVRELKIRKKEINEILEANNTNVIFNTFFFSFNIPKKKTKTEMKKMRDDGRNKKWIQEKRTIINIINIYKYKYIWLCCCNYKLFLCCSVLKWKQ